MDSASLPGELINQLSDEYVCPETKCSQCIVDVLKKSKEPLTIDEIILSIYEEFGYIKKRSVILTRLSELHCSGEIVRKAKQGRVSKRGCYAISRFKTEVV